MGFAENDPTLCSWSSSEHLSSEAFAKCLVFFFFFGQAGALCPFLLQKLHTSSINLQSLASWLDLPHR